MDRWDVLALLGTALLGAGLGLVAPWLGIAAVGVVLLGIGIVGALLTERAGRAVQEPSPRPGGEG